MTAQRPWRQEGDKKRGYRGPQTLTHIGRQGQRVPESTGNSLLACSSRSLGMFS